MDAAILELIPGEPQPFEGVEVHEVETTAPIHEGLGESGCPDQWVDYEGELSRLGNTVQVIRPIESDWGLRSVKVLWGSRAYGVDCPACKLELTPGLVGGGWPAID
jgi:hypothetical protein